MQTSGKIIKKLRMEKKLTQEQLGVLLGVKKSAIQKYENGMIQNLKLKTIRTLCEIFKVPPYLFVYPELTKIYNIEKNANEEISEHFSLEIYSNFILNFHKLNNEGQRKIIEYGWDLLENNKYKRRVRQ